MKDEIQDYTPEDDNSDLKEKIEKAKLHQRLTLHLQL